MAFLQCETPSTSRKSSPPGQDNFPSPGRTDRTLEQVKFGLYIFYQLVESASTKSSTIATLRLLERGGSTWLNTSHRPKLFHSVGLRTTTCTRTHARETSKRIWPHTAGQLCRQCGPCHSCILWEIHFTIIAHELLPPLHAERSFMEHHVSNKKETSLKKALFTQAPLVILFRQLLTGEER